MNHPAATDVIDRVNTLQFIDAMTGRVAWPLAAVVIGLMFRRSLIELLRRVRKFRVRDVEAELAEETDLVEEALREAAQPLTDDAEAEARQRERIEHLLRSAARWGFRISELLPDVNRLPPVKVDWLDNGITRLRVGADQGDISLIIHPEVPDDWPPTRD